MGDSAAGAGGSSPGLAPAGPVEILADIDGGTWAPLSVAGRVIAPFDPVAAHAIVAAAISQGANVVAAVTGRLVVGLAVTGPDDALLALGVAPDHRRADLATAMLRASHARTAEVTVAERDPIDPWPHALRAGVGRSVFEAAGFRVSPAAADVRSVDPRAISATRD